VVSRAQTTHPFVGRGLQVRRLLAAAEAAFAGEGSFVLVSGEPGIGKTRLVEQAARTAAERGLRVLWATCWEGDGVPALWPWTRLVPEFEWHRGTPARGTGEDRFRLFEDVTALLRRTAAERPLLLVIDDLQWADTASLLLLRFVAHHLRGTRLLVAGTYRDVEICEPLRELLASTGGRYEHIVLEGLTRSEVAGLVGSLTGVDPPADQAAALHRRTNGNPLFVRELVRLMGDAGDGAEFRVPDGLREVIQRRLDRLSEPCRALLLTASVLGQQFRLGLLAATEGQPAACLAGPLEEALTARLVEEVPGVVPRYRFTHALVAEVLWQALSAGRRSELNLRAALAMEELHAGDICGEVVRLACSTGNRRLELRARSLRAGSLLEVGDVDAVRVEVEMCEVMAEDLRRGDREWHQPMVRAGLAAMSGALEEAERLAEHARTRGEATQHPGLAVYHGSVIVLIRFLQGRLPELEAVLRRSAERYPAAPEWRCTLVLALSDAGRTDEARQQFEAIAAEDFAMVSTHLPRLHTLALLATACDAVGDVRRAELLHPFLAPRGGYFVQIGQTGTGCLGSAWYFAGLLCCTMARWDEAVAHLERAVEANARIGAVPFVANSRFQLARALRARRGPGDRARAREQLDRAQETARALGMRPWRGGAEPDRPLAAPLTAREWEVTRLVADGLGNGEIAERLCLSKRTVESHVEHVRGKLGLGSRLEIMSWVVRHT
jgi:ATP/maltotriose-dependent transcriptional regulator MalT